MVEPSPSAALTAERPLTPVPVSGLAAAPRRGLQLVNGRPVVRILRGQRAILAMQGELAELARRCGQSGEVDNLSFFLTTPGALLKRPWLVCGWDAQGTLTSAVLLFQYRLGPFGLPIFTTSDATGRRNVLAPPAERESVAAVAARHLLRGGAHVVHIALSRTHQADDRQPPQDLTLAGEATDRIFGTSSGDSENFGSGHWALREQEMRLYLPLAGTYDETLARIGQRTRSNLRYYRRRAEADLGSRFVANAEPTREEFIAFDRRCSYAVGDRNAAWRFDSLGRLRSYFLAGVRGRDGDWLAMVGGRRQSGFAEIDWQMNRGDLPAYSLSTVLRGYLIEHEIGLGSTRLYVEGGTPQPIRLSFATEQVAELTVVRNSLYGRLVKRFAPRLAPERNYLAQVLSEPGLEWHRF